MNADTLVKKINKHHLDFNEEIVKEAIKFAESKHNGQKRLSGLEYITHPLEVASILIDLEVDDLTVVAAILHDTLEDTDTTYEEISEIFGPKVAELVDGVTKLGSIDFSQLPNIDLEEVKKKSEIESLRKFFLAIAKDVRVVIIKLADRLHNMRTLGYLSQKDQKRISKETLDIFAPLADRFGFGSIKSELEDLSFKYLFPEDFVKIAELVESTKKEREHYLSKIKKYLINELEKEGIKADVDGRVKHLYSIFNKMEKVGNDFTKIYDLLAVRIIVNNVEDCYKALGVVHKNFKPLIYRIKDYIAVPKPNGYQSLHTTVFGIDGRITEIQIRTDEMHAEAERGVAAHWYYNERKKTEAYKGKTSHNKGQHWANKIVDWQSSLSNDDEFRESLKLDIFNDRIFAFSPKGDIFDLPDGATPIDFAYEVHTQIGHRCRGAKVNGKIVQLDQKLSNRDVVEIILAPKNDKTGPSRGWLDFVKTQKAKQNIRSFFKKLNWEDNVEAGRKLLTQELTLFGVNESDLQPDQIRELLSETPWKGWEDVLVAIGEGAVTARQIIKRIIGQKIYIKEDLPKSIENVSDKDSYSNMSGILVRYAACCRPKSGDKIKGFITQGQGITIHKDDCPNLLASPQEKVINIDFENSTNAKIMIEGENRIGFIRDVTFIISDEKININNIKNEHYDDKSVIYVELSLANPYKLADLLHRLLKIEGVKSVKKQ